MSSSLRETNSKLSQNMMVYLYCLLSNWHETAATGNGISLVVLTRSLALTVVLRPNMAALVEGQQYGLSSNFSPHDQKTVVQVKLTDSALKAIDEYLKLKVKFICFT